jgi:hypothetical protein
VRIARKKDPIVHKKESRILDPREKKKNKK